MKQLIFGGARSGKSRLAEQLTGAYGDNIAYIATADSRFHDTEMKARVAHHLQQRPTYWHTLEQPLKLGHCLQQCDQGYDAIMVDCLTLWLTNALMAEEQQAGAWQQEKHELLDTLAKMTTPVIMVSNEVGMGIVPLGQLNRRFVDEAGFLNQDVARLSDRTIFTAAGLPMVLKGPALPQ